MGWCAHVVTALDLNKSRDCLLQNRKHALISINQGGVRKRHKLTRRSFKLHADKKQTSMQPPRTLSLHPTCCPDHTLPVHLHVQIHALPHFRSPPPATERWQKNRYPTLPQSALCLVPLLYTAASTASIQRPTQHFISWDLALTDPQPHKKRTTFFSPNNILLCRYDRQHTAFDCTEASLKCWKVWRQCSMQML